MKLKFKILILSFLVTITSIVGYSFAAQSDLLDTAMSDSKANDTVVDVGSTSEGVGNWFFKGGYTIGLDGIKRSEPFLVRVAKFLLKITVAIGITMFMIGGIMYLLSFGDQGAMRKALKNLIIGGAGIVLALFSMAIIDLITSITTSLRI